MVNARLKRRIASMSPADRRDYLMLVNVLRRLVKGDTVKLRLVGVTKRKRA